MYSFELIEHTADVRLYVRADTIQELFRAALEGMNSLMFSGDLADTPVSIKEEIHIDAPDCTALLVDFMNEVLAFSHIDSALFSYVTFDSFSQTNLSGCIEGYPTDHFDEDIKAVTYHEANVIQNDVGLYETTIVFDI